MAIKFNMVLKITQKQVDVRVPSVGVPLEVVESAWCLVIKVGHLSVGPLFRLCTVPLRVCVDNRR